MTEENPAPTLVAFARGVISILSLWPAMRLAVDQGWGGPESAQKRRWLSSVIVDAFEELQAPNEEYVEEILLQVMEDEFEVSLEDGSAQLVARDIVKLWHEVNAGSLDALLKLESQAVLHSGKRVEVVEGPADDSDWEDESDSAEEAQSGEEIVLQPAEQPVSKVPPTVDEDGFTLVQRKGKGRSN